LIMPYDPEKLYRRSLRLKGYDYSSVGAYFITVCVQNRRCLLGEISVGKMDLSHAGRMVMKWWEQLEEKFESVKADEFTIMPNHVHRIIQIVACRGRINVSALFLAFVGRHTGLPLLELPI